MHNNSLLEMRLSWGEKLNYIKCLNLFVYFQFSFVYIKKWKLVIDEPWEQV